VITHAAILRPASTAKQVQSKHTWQWQRAVVISSQQGAAISLGQVANGPAQVSGQVSTPGVNSHAAEPQQDKVKVTPLPAARQLLAKFFRTLSCICTGLLGNKSTGQG
jgi:hypothetical protein